MSNDRATERQKAVDHLRRAVEFLDNVGEGLAAIHVSHAIELLDDIRPDLRAEAS